MSYLIQDLSINLSNKTILKNIDLTIKKGHFVGIIGPNGSGKSTLLKCLYKELKNYSGTIIFENQDLQEWKPKNLAQRNAVVAQLNEIDFDFTVLDMVLMGREPYKNWWQSTLNTDVELALHMLEQVGLLSYQDAYFSTLSGGEKQRVILARALTQEADYLILDEPTNHLDIKNQIEFLNLVKNLDLTVISVIHDLNLAANYCDELYLIKAGQIQTKGQPKDVLTENNIKQVFEIDCKIYELNEQIQIVYHMG